MRGNTEKTKRGYEGEGEEGCTTNAPKSQINPLISKNKRPKTQANNEDKAYAKNEKINYKD